MLLDETAWKTCVAHHGHECGGIALGFKAVEAVVNELGLSLDNPAVGEGLTCVSTTVKCPVDAMRGLLGCTEARGNLTLAPEEELSFTVRMRETGACVRLVAKEGGFGGRHGAEAIAYALATPYTEFFQAERLEA